MSDEHELHVVGWRERIDLPEWGVSGIIAKIDSGARTSAVHVINIEWLSEDRVAFEVVLDRRNLDQGTRVEAHVVRSSRVRSSNGQVQERIVVETEMRIGPVSRRIEMSLVCRKHMLCRMLVGRTGLEGTFLIDPSRRYVLSDKPRRKRRKRTTASRDGARRKDSE